MGACKKLQVVKKSKPGGNTHLTDHEVELMRIMHEEYPRSHKRHLGYHKLSAIFGTSYPHTRNICLYRKRVAHL